MSVNAREPTFLTTGQLLDALLLVEFLGVERDTDTDSDVVVNLAGGLLVVRLLGVVAGISPALDDEATVGGWDKLLENGGELLRDLLECSLDSFVFAEI